MVGRDRSEGGLSGGLRSDDVGGTVTVRTQFFFMGMIVGILHLILETRRPINYKKRKRMAYRLARIFGTEEDKVNCAFYYKIGACRHGDRCTRLHNKPLLSQTVLLKNMYVNPAPALALAEGKKI